ncbi:MAG TPA: DUF2271 domain-containing protein [Dinghuibacter sp.]|uniref:DUF2271 domain-containing protein n=1 Tax=Dinghuibacter sp. TaxID=2024697 RepID=UPI002CC88BA0|nr:DUF2271 domain-containing protein [Dinghuibacter sp.]HTJ13315.1 DUF2271 domain-containing protein [Dinghuibacter sp.]
MKTALLLALLTTVRLGGNTPPPPIPLTGNVPHPYVSHFENVLGTSMELKVTASTDKAYSQAENAVLAEIARLSHILSGYDPASEFGRWEQTYNQPIPVSRELFEVLDLFDRWRQRTDGALDASAEVVTQAWKRAAAAGRPPTAAELSAAVEEVRQVHWTLDRDKQTATHLSRTPLMLNSFAKSYIIRHAAMAALANPDVHGIVVNIGGDLVVAGDVHETVDISDPRADAENDTPMGVLTVHDRAVATSGNYRRGEMIGGRWYSHIVDPRTGQPADDILSATVVAPGATDAGALATAFNVMKVSESVRLAASIPGVDYLIITRDGRRVESPGWKTLEVKTAPAAAPGDFEVLVSLEINLQKESFVKRPYVAVWVEDENHAPVRTISLWHGADRYLPELKSWYLKYHGLYAADQRFNASLTSATRSAGKYTVKWDGRDDQGNVVKPGKYIIKIEAAREHGTYQLMRQEIACDDTPKEISIPGNVEIATASLDYRKKTNGQ